LKERGRGGTLRRRVEWAREREHVEGAREGWRSEGARKGRHDEATCDEGATRGEEATRRDKGDTWRGGDATGQRATKARHVTKGGRDKVDVRQGRHMAKGGHDKGDATDSTHGRGVHLGEGELANEKRKGK
jgi:hypothetical protein